MMSSSIDTALTDALLGRFEALSRTKAVSSLKATAEVRQNRAIGRSLTRHYLGKLGQQIPEDLARKYFPEYADLAYGRTDEAAITELLKPVHEG